MLAEWSVECGPDDPVLVVPWSDPSDPSGERRFIDLRENPYDLDEIPETEQHPALLQALRALNANRSPVFTAKCDAWVMDADELAALHLEIELETADPAHDLAHGFASYIDLVWRERGLFVSFHQQEQLLHRLVRTGRAAGPALCGARLHAAPGARGSERTAGGICADALCEGAGRGCRRRLPQLDGGAGRGSRVGAEQGAAGDGGLSAPCFRKTRRGREPFTMRPAEPPWASSSIG